MQLTDTTNATITGGSYPAFSTDATGTLTQTGNLTSTSQDVLDDCTVRTNTGSTAPGVPTFTLNGTHVFQGSRLVAIDFNHTEGGTPDNHTLFVTTGRLVPPP